MEDPRDQPRRATTDRGARAAAEKPVADSIGIPFFSIVGSKPDATLASGSTAISRSALSLTG